MKKIILSLTIVSIITLFLGLLFFMLPFILMFIDTIKIVLLTIITFGLIFLTDQGKQIAQKEIAQGWQIMSYISWALLAITIILSVTVIVLNIKKNNSEKSNYFIFACVATPAATFLLIIGIIFWNFSYFV